MPLPLDAPDEPPPPREPTGSDVPQRVCQICGVLREGRVCPTCGIDLVTGELVAEPGPDPRRPEPPPELALRRSVAAPRSPADLLRATALESLRGWLGTFLAVLWSFPSLLLGRFGLCAVLAVVLSERARAALGSPVVLRGAVYDADPDAPAAPALTPNDGLLIGVKAMLATALLAPVVLAALTPERLDALRGAGVLLAGDGVLGPRFLAVGTVFFTAAVGFLALRLSPGERRMIRGVGAQPYDVLELPGSALKACLLFFLLYTLSLHPLALLVWIPFGPLLVGALASGWEDLAPRPLLHALRTTPRYLLFVVASAPCLLTLSLLLGGWLRLGVLLTVVGSVALTTLVGILAGIARQDCEGAQLLVADDATEAE